MARDAQFLLRERRNGLPKCSMPSDDKEFYIVLISTLLLLAAHLFFTYLGGSLVWKEFLALEPSSIYCVRSIWQMNPVYYLLPVLLKL